MIWLFLGLAWGSPLEEAATVLEAGDPAAAVEILEPIASAGGASAAVHYDLGCAYYRQSDLPRAVAHWRHAHLRSPRSGDIAHNLALARGELKAVEAPVASAAAWMDLITVGELGLLGVLVALWGSVLGVRASRRETAPWGGVGIGVLGLVIGGVALQAAWSLEDHPIAVIVEPARARDAPSLQGGERFVLKPGTETRVIRRSGDFVLLETGGGRRGWVSGRSAVIPRL